MTSTENIEKLIDLIPDGIFSIDPSTFKILYANSSFCNYLEYTQSEILEMPVTNLLENLSVLDQCMLNIQQSGKCFDQETKFINKNGNIVTLSKNVQALYNDDLTINKIVVVTRSMSNLQNINKELERQVDQKVSELIHHYYYDILTNLPNQHKLKNDLQELTEEYGLILLQIDRLQELNTIYGYDSFQKIIKNIAEFLKIYIDDLNNLTLYKISEDKHVILFKKSPEKSDIDFFCYNLLQDLLLERFLTNNHEIHITATIGIAKGNQYNSHNVMNEANMAIDYAKTNKNAYAFYCDTHRIKENYQSTLTWINKLSEAINEDRIIPYYQPIVCAKNKQIEKYEALVRLKERDGELITPIHFLDIAKQSHMYSQITRIMVQKVFKKLHQNPDMVCSINLSIEDIMDINIQDFIYDALNTFGHGHRVIFEILESEGITNYETVIEFIRKVKTFNVRIALDDFGSGYSNFAYLTKLELDFMKIDGSLIKDIYQNESSQIITQTLVDFAKKLRIKTIAEFVGNEEISSYLEKLEIDHMQGYYYGVPMDLP